MQQQLLLVCGPALLHAPKADGGSGRYTCTPSGMNVVAAAKMSLLPTSSRGIGVVVAPCSISAVQQQHQPTMLDVLTAACCVGLH